MMRPMRALSDIRSDIAYAWRVLKRSPWLVAMAVITLTLGIGANVTVFTLANAFLFKNLPFADSRRILYVSGTVLTRPGTVRSVSYPDFLEFQAQSHAFDGLAALSNRSVDLSDARGFPERYRGAAITANGFTVIGQHAVRGRDFVPEDELPGAPAVVIISHGLWESRYAADANVIGTTIRVNDLPAVIVGVMPRGVTFPGASSVWMPLVRSADPQQREVRSLTLFGRLAGHATIASARAELAAIARRLTTSTRRRTRTRVS
jgi:hypothetical protein